jgi:hypothetical protein
MPASSAMGSVHARVVATTPVLLDGREATVRTTRSRLTDLIGAAMRR